MFGVEIPNTVKEALELDKKNGNNLWRDAIEKEMKNVKVAFKLTDNVGGKETVGFQKITCHMVFVVKMDFTRKARFVAGGHRQLLTTSHKIPTTSHNFPQNSDRFRP